MTEDRKNGHADTNLRQSADEDNPRYLPFGTAPGDDVLLWLLVAGKLATTVHVELSFVTRVTLPP